VYKVRKSKVDIIAFAVVITFVLSFSSCQNEEIPSDEPGVKRLTYEGGKNPAFSPNGRKIVFVSDRDGNDEIYIMNSDGTGQTRLTSDELGDDSPVFSPDGSKIAYVSEGYKEGHGTCWSIYIMNNDGTGNIRISGNKEGDDLDPHFSPDGEKLLFVNNHILGSEIFIINRDGSNRTCLTESDGDNDSPRFSPNGNRIVFWSSRDVYGDIYIMNADGSGQTRLTYNDCNDEHPSFSPDGGKIAFTSYRDGTGRKLFVMNSDGSDQIKLTEDSVGEPLFSPTENRIAFHAHDDFWMGINIINSNGNNRLHVGHEGFDDRLGAFSYDGLKIVFTSRSPEIDSNIYIVDVP
jgi:Tol biopolymer transport system component